MRDREAGGIRPAGRAAEARGRRDAGRARGRRKRNVQVGTVGVMS